MWRSELIECHSHYAVGRRVKRGPRPARILPGYRGGDPTAAETAHAALRRSSSELRDVQAQKSLGSCVHFQVNQEILSQFSVAEGRTDFSSKTE